MDNVLKFESQNKPNINRPLSLFDRMTQNFFIEYPEKIKFVTNGFLERIIINTNQKSPKRGLALCHGHNHSNILLQKIKFINYWYFVDKNKDTFPDYICDVKDDNKMKYIPNEYFDCIVTMHCPIDFEFELILLNINRILKDNGTLLLTELPEAFSNLLDGKNLGLLSHSIIDIIGEDNFSEFKKQYNEKINPQTDIMEIIHILSSGKVYRGPMWKELNKHMENKSMEFTKTYLLRFGFQFIKKTENFMIVKKQ